MAGEKVGVLKYRDYDASLVVREGGVIRETNVSFIYTSAQFIKMYTILKPRNGIFK